jgi:hypothetical protein
MPILGRASWQARPHRHERLDARNFEHHDQPFVLRRHRTGVFPQNGEKKSLNVIPSV